MIKPKKRDDRYWQERFKLLEQLSEDYCHKAYSEIEKAFNCAGADIQKEIDAWYSRFAKNNGITLTEARKLLNSKELAELKWDVSEYIKRGQENAVNGQWIKELENASARVHISRLEALKIRTQNVLESAFKTELDEVSTMACNIVENGYYRTVFEMQKGFGFGWEVGELDQNKLNKIISKPWTTDGKTFSDRIWNRQQQMINNLHQELTRNCIYGRPFNESVQHMEQYVNSNIKNAKYAAERLVRTESAYFNSVSQKEGLDRVGTKWYEIYSVIDNKTCPVCREMNGKKFPMSEFQVGITAPPFHPNCDKSSITPCSPDNEREIDRIFREAEESIKNAEPISDKERFEDWKKKFVYGNNPETKSVDNSRESGIIKSLDIDDFEMMSEGKDIDPKAIDTISSVIKKYEKSGDMYINDFYFGSLAAENIGTPLLQIEPVADKTLRLNVNTDVFSGKTVADIDEMLKSYDKNLAVSLEEAIIHECGHAISLKGLKISEIQSLYNEIADAEIEGISKIAYNDGAEALAEIEVLISREAEIPKKAMDFYNKYMRRK